MSNHEKINYLEFPSKDLEVTKKFFSQCFAWEFIDYGPEYMAITAAGIDGGFYLSEIRSFVREVYLSPYVQIFSFSESSSH
ncbi:hypothetical protein [Lentisphaera araneosa]|uniref:hypothetical protein n=1 Tax=Lentisphaera araneosa TaxID=256847 RepID=UPI0006974FF2|nr:hypothetical protein [Lentisphaera araneosa]